MKVDNKLVNAAIDFVNRRFPTRIEGASAMYLDDGQILISTAPAVVNEAVSTCHETGALCEVYKLDRKVVATVCVSRDEKGFHILTPCGVCQERLWVYGGDVDCAVPKPNNSLEWTTMTLSQLSPSYWRKPFMDVKS